MTIAARTGLVARDTILKLMSDEEIARVSTAEAASGLSDGAEYLDLEQIDRGIQRADPATMIAMGHVVPRGAVSAGTWTKILAQVAQ